MANDKKTVWIISAIGLLVFVYVAARAWLLSFTWDESYTFLEFVRNDSWDPWQRGDMSANNHWLNTWGMKIMSALFGNGEFILRLPNILSYILYAVYSAKIVLHFKKTFFIISAFLLLNLNPLLLDFFSLARGYGLSMAFMMCSLYFLFRFLEDKSKTRSVLFSLLFGSLSVLASIPLLNYFCALLTVIYVVTFFRFIKKKSERKNIFLQAAISLLVPAAVLFYVLPRVFAMKKMLALYYGGTKNFWSDTVESSVKIFLYDEKNYSSVLALEIFVAIVIAVSVLVIAFNGIRRKNDNTFLVPVVFMFLFSAFASILQHWFLSTPYLIERTALLFVPLFSIVLVFLLGGLKNTHPRLFWLAPFFAGALLVHFLRNANFYFVQQWREDADVKAVVEYLEKNRISLSPERENIYVGMEFIYWPEIDYYRATRHLSWLNVARTQAPLPAHDYYLQYEMNPAEPKMKNAELLVRFPEKTLLYRNLVKPSSMNILFHQKINFESSPPEGMNFYNVTDLSGFNSLHCSKTDTAHVFSDGFTYLFNSDTLHEYKVLVVFKAKVRAHAPHFDAQIVFQLDSAGEAVYWLGGNIKDFMQESGKWETVYLTTQFPFPVKQGETAKAYLWNTDKGEVLIDDMEIKIIAYRY